MQVLNFTTGKLLRLIMLSVMDDLPEPDAPVMMKMGGGMVSFNF